MLMLLAEFSATQDYDRRRLIYTPIWAKTVIWGSPSHPYSLHFSLSFIWIVGLMRPRSPDACFAGSTTAVSFLGICKAKNLVFIIWTSS